MANSPGWCCRYGSRAVMAGEMKCSFPNPALSTLIVCDLSRRDCSRPHLLWKDRALCLFPEDFIFIFFSNLEVGFGRIASYLCVCPRRAQDLIWLLSIHFCYLAGIVGGCVN